MTTAVELLRQGRLDVLWQKYGGFLDANVEEFMIVQERLLLEQLKLLEQMPLGRELMRGKAPASVQEFRQTIPLTTYKDYAPFLQDQNDSMLLEKPATWVRTSGRSGEHTFKWVPYSKGMYRKATEQAFAGLVIGSASKRGEVVLEEGDIILHTLAPAPYVSGAVWSDGILDQFPFRFVPPLADAAKMDFGERIQTGFKLALKTGIDIVYGIGSVLLRVAEQFASGGQGLTFSSFYLHPSVLSRLGRGMLKARLAGRPMLPRDLWNVKYMGVGGTDASIFRGKLADFWGREPIEGYAGSEMGIVAGQVWNHKGMVFWPDANFLEFIPESEHIRSRQDPTYEPKTVLMSEVEAGHKYEIVVTNFHGGVFVRYRPGDLIEIVALRDEEVAIETPQMVFHSRADEIIDIAGFTRLTEKTIWQAIHATGVAYNDWVACKEVEGDRPLLHVYIELKRDEDLAKLRLEVHNNLIKLDADYRDLGRMLNVDPLTLTQLSPGTFGRYLVAKKEAGAELAHLKPPHINPSAQMVGQLLSASRAG